MTITIQSVVPVIVGITIFLVILFKWANTKLLAFDPLSKPTGVVLVCIMFVEFIDLLLKSFLEVIRIQIFINSSQLLFKTL